MVDTAAAGENEAAPLRWAVWEEFSGLRPRMLLLNLLLTPWPAQSFVRVRTALIRRAGFTVGRGTAFFGRPILRGGPDMHRNLHIGDWCQINESIHFDLWGSITIGDRVAVGQEVMLLTNSHKIGPEHQRSWQTVVKPIVIEIGAWVGARAIILPGVTIGEGAIVAAGAVVTTDVAPNTLVAGSPAAVRRKLPLSSDSLVSNDELPPSSDSPVSNDDTKSVA